MSKKSCEAAKSTEGTFCECDGARELCASDGARELCASDGARELCASDGARELCARELCTSDGARELCASDGARELICITKRRQSSMIALRKEDIFPQTSFHIAESSFTPSPSYHHDHDYYEILIVETGNLLHYVNDVPTTMHMDMLALLFPEDHHYFKGTGSGPSRLVNLAFSKEIFEKACRALQAVNPSFTAPCNCNALHMTREMSNQLQQRFWNLLHTEFPGGFHASSDTLPPVRSCISDALLVSIVMDVLTLTQNPDTGIQNLPGWLENACDDMHSQPNLIQGLPRFIQLCNKSQEHVTRTMQRHMNLTPTAYINMLRLDFVANQLTTTDKPILEIAMDAGFQNLSYFNKLFRDKYHLTPREYRLRSLTVLGMAAHTNP